MGRYWSSIGMTRTQQQVIQFGCKFVQPNQTIDWKTFLNWFIRRSKKKFKHGAKYCDLNLSELD